ncbi:hypothetical protein MIMGU_mgv11b017891mg [Erythranthe guttata]|uniref:protein-serine/threonine phosphatase n=1 Tax=Erythranthe guttata TaxID=4155 RepID=A0A022Q3W1_ERYGU|nr:hypothetical protein MIMGU_mgv11b017891mg [Erythranthe guttata]
MCTNSWKKLAYTMGERPYALEMAKIYTHARIIARENATQMDHKSLDVVLAKESAVIILDDTEAGHKDCLEERDVRRVILVRPDGLVYCFLCNLRCRISAINFDVEQHPLWRMAEQLGATCSNKLDPCVTHVVCLDTRNHKSRWAVHQNKFLVRPECLP